MYYMHFLHSFVLEPTQSPRWWILHWNTERFGTAWEQSPISTGPWPGPIGHSCIYDWYGMFFHHMENYTVPVVYTRVAKRLRPRAFRDRGLLPLGFECLRISTQNPSQIQSPRGDVSLRVYERVGASVLWCPSHGCTTDCHAGPLDSVHADPWPRGQFSVCNCNHLPG